jgi:hypothetical protein
MSHGNLLKKAVAERPVNDPLGSPAISSVEIRDIPSPPREGFSFIELLYM